MAKKSTNDSKGVFGVVPLEITTAIEAITISKMVKNVESGKWDTDPAYHRW